MTAITGTTRPPAKDFTRMAYDDLPTPEELRDDCRAAGVALAFVPAPRTHHRLAPQLRLEDLGDRGSQPARGDTGLVAAAHRVADALSLEQD